MLMKKVPLWQQIAIENENNMVGFEKDAAEYSKSSKLVVWGA